jgi:hypothetical protein
MKEKAMQPVNAAPERAKYATKEARAREAALAMRDYEAEKLAALAKTARLRALRLASEAASAPPVKAGKAAGKGR